MKQRFLIPVTSVLLLAGCSTSLPKFGSEAGQKDSAESADSAATDLYVGDAADAASSSEGVAATTVDCSVKGDLKSDRLAAMAGELLKTLDADSSGNLSLEEFLSLPDKVKAPDNRPEPPADAKERMKAKFTEDFKKFAGDDSLLSSDELIQLLTAFAPRVAHRRHGECGGEGGRKPGEGPGESWDQILAKYDKDGDKVLNQAEFEAFMKDKQQEHRRGGGPGPRKGPGPGHGPRP